MDKRKKLSEAKLNEIRAMLAEGVKPQSVAWQFGISNTHIYRIQSAMRKGEVKLKRSSLDSCLGHIKNGLPFRRVVWPEKLYYYCAIDEPTKWFVEVNTETGCEVITFRLNLTLEDLLAKDWVVLTWESVEDHIVDADKKVWVVE